MPLQLRFDPQSTGLHLTELFAEPGLVDLLPGLLPTELDAGDEWDDELMRADGVGRE